MPKTQIRVLIPAYFTVDMTAEAYFDMTLDEREDIGFEQLGQYPVVDLRHASFDIEDLMVLDEIEEEEV